MFRHKTSQADFSKELDFSRGLLKIDDTDTILLGEVGIKGKLRQNVNVLLSNLPKKDISSYPYLQSIYPTLFRQSKLDSMISAPSSFFQKMGFPTSTQEVEPPAEIKFQDRNNLDDRDYVSMTPTNLTKGQEVIIRNVRNPLSRVTPHSTEDYHPDYVHVTVYRKLEKKGNLPESDHEIEIVQEGYLPRNLVKPSEDFFVPLHPEESIFDPKHLPKEEEIRQACIGDCFLLSTTLAILNCKKNIGHQRYSGADHILKMMYQPDQFHTIVKLYDPNAEKFVYFKVRNLIYFKENQLGVNHKVAWPAMLELAYAALGAKEDKKRWNKISYVNPSFQGVYGTGGDPALAMKILTGKEAETISLQHKHHEGDVLPWCYDHNSVCLSVLRTLDAIDATREALENATDEETEALSRTLEFYIDQMKGISSNLRGLNNPLTIPEAKEWGEFFKKVKENSNFYETFKKIMYPKTPDVSYDEACQMLNELKRAAHQAGIPLPENALTRFYQFITEGVRCSIDNQLYSRLPGSFSSGLYSAAQMTIFLRIKQELLKGNLVVASTSDRFKNDMESAGVRPGHAYAVINIVEETINHCPRKFIRMINPWGKIGRNYNWDNETAVEMESNLQATSSGGEFDLELSELHRYFEFLSIGKFFDSDLQPTLQKRRNFSNNNNNETTSMPKFR